MTRLHLRLQVAQLMLNATSFAVLALLAPGVLRLEPDLANAALIETAWTYPIVLALASIGTAFRIHRFTPMLRRIEVGELADHLDAGLVQKLHALPFMWVSQLTLQAMAVASLTILKVLRPSIIDSDTQVAIVLLTATVVAAVSLPLYVIARTVVAQALEAMPWRAVEAAMAADDADATRPRAGVVPRLERVIARLPLAVAVPVTIVAVGSALLVDAHVRASDTRRRRDDAYVLAHAVLEDSNPAGRDEAMATARQLGFQVSLEDAEGLVPVAMVGVGGIRTLRTRLHDSENSAGGEVRDLVATVRFAPPGGNTPILALALIGSVALLLAVMIGRSLGRAISGELRTASREVRLLGTQQVMAGATRVAGPANFTAIAELTEGIEAVAERFREFATGRERMIDARESAQRMRDLFLASMSHDLRSPLNGILGFVALLSKSDLAPGQLESLAIIERRGRELLELIENILDAAKIEAGRLDLSRDYVSADEVLEEALDRGEELVLDKPSVEVLGEASPDLPLLWVDGPRLTKALVNVVANAVRSMDRGVVRIRMSRSARGTLPHLRIEVVDHGRGIPEKELAQIFDAFRQPLRSRRHGGLGLGLSMTRAIVDLHGGVVDVASSPERGSTFTLWIPLSSTSEVGQVSRIPTPLRELRSRPDASSERHGPRDGDPTVQMPALELSSGPPDDTPHGPSLAVPDQRSDTEDGPTSDGS